MKITIEKEHFVYLAQLKSITINKIELSYQENGKLKRKIIAIPDTTEDINNPEKKQFELTLDGIDKAQNWFVQVFYGLT